MSLIYFEELLASKKNHVPVVVNTQYIHSKDIYYFLQTKKLSAIFIHISMKALISTHKFRFVKIRRMFWCR